MLKTDGAAALGVVNRPGIGKMSHMCTQELRNAKRNSESGNLSAEDRWRKHLVSDILTKNVKAGVLEKHKVAMRFSRKDSVQQGNQRSSEKQISAVSNG